MWCSKQRRKGVLLRKHSSHKINEHQFNSQQWKNYNFDESTGQMYTEQVVSLSTAVDLEWTQRTGLDVEPDYPRGEKWDRQRTAWRDQTFTNVGQRQESVGMVQKPGVNNQKGAPSLQKIALQKVLQNVSDITFETIQHLPSQLIRRIWDLLIRNGRLSFNTWTIFSKCLRQETSIQPEILIFAQSIATPKLPLRVYAAPITSDAFDFITSLSITVPFPIPDLVKLCCIKNLGTLEIIKSDHTASSGSEEELHFGVGDRLMRTWHHAAANEGAFPVLRVMKLRYHRDLTDWSLNYLNAFPSLAIFDVKDCGFSHDSKKQARALGWTISYATDLPRLLGEACAKRATCLAPQSSEIYSDTGAISDHSSGISVVRRVPRSQMPAFFKRSLASRSVQAIKTSKPMQEGARSPQRPRIALGMNTKPWESTIYNMFTRIGELRNDSDLVRAGVDIGDQAVLGDEVLSSIPVVCIQLGSLLHDNHLTPISQVDPGGLSFIRIKAPSAEEARTDKQDMKPAAQTRGRMETAAKKTVGASKVLKSNKPPVGVMRTKKRKLEDELNSFL